MSTKPHFNRLLFPQPKRRRPGSARVEQTIQPLMEPLEARVLLSALDLTGTLSCGMLNGAIFRQVNPRSTGTGVIYPFVRIQGGTHSPVPGEEQGYNTDYRPLGDDPILLDVDTSPFTRSLLLSNVPKVNIEGRWYREFFLDNNESNTPEARLLSLDELEIYLGSAADLIGYPALGDKVYDMDVGPDGDSWVKLDYNLGTGSGSGDMIVYVPESGFTGPNKYVYLYSKFGVNIPIDDGFEEWSVGKDGEPGSVTGEIHGYKFEDVNGNGIDDGEPRLPDWTFFLDADDDGQLDPDEASTVTDAAGEYHFTNLIAGMGTLSTFRVREVTPQGWVQTTPPAGMPNITLDVVNISTNPKKPEYVGDVYVAFNGQQGFYESEPWVYVNGNLAFGNFELITIGGMKFEDIANNGEKDPGDPGLDGWTIQLYEDTNDNDVLDGEDTLIDTAVTGADGSYLLDLGIGLGTYFVTEVLQNGWTPTMPMPPEPSRPGYYTIIVTTSGEDVVEQDFGNHWELQPEEAIVNIFGMKFEDTNLDRTYNDGEPVLPGWTIELYLDSNEDGIPQSGEFIGSRVTDVDGRYEYRDLNGENTYLVREVLVSGWMQTTPNPGSITGEEGLHLVYVPFEDFVVLEDHEIEVVQPALAFGNVPIVDGDARTKGFWANKNGQKLITNGDLEVLRGLNLRNADGSDFDPANKAQLRKWLRKATATNMANMLSVQLAAMQLNLLHGDVTGVAEDSGILVTNPDGTLRNVTVADLILEADAALATSPYVLGGDPLRPYLESLKNALDDANNNLNWLAP